MLARLTRELPVGAWSYEPKWDGFRCVASVAEGKVRLHSRHGRPLARYFPEVVQALASLPDAVLDGELVIAAERSLAEFAALLARLHPSASRVERLSRDTPASFVAFDLVAHAGEDLMGQPFVARRARLEALLAGRPPPLLLTPTTRDPAVARRWLEPGARGVDGVVAKQDALTYQPAGGRW